MIDRLHKLLNMTLLDNDGVEEALNVKCPATKEWKKLEADNCNKGKTFS